VINHKYWFKDTTDRLLCQSIKLKKAVSVNKVVVRWWHDLKIQV